MDKTMFYSDYKDFALKAAKELKYREECYDKIKNAKSDSEIQRITKTERERSFED